MSVASKLFIILFLAAFSACSLDTRIPVIAIISQPATTYGKWLPGAGQNFSEVVGSYVDWVEQTGAASALVPFDMPWETLIKVLGETQGLVLPGGAAELINFADKRTTDYMNRINQILEWVKERNDKGFYYPVWGTCLGFEEMVVSFSGLKADSISLGWNDKNAFHKIDIRPDYWKSPFFSKLNASKAAQMKVYDNDIAYYFHSEGISVKNFKAHKALSNDLKIQGTSKNAEGNEFIAILEAQKYPMYFTQYHPEKHQFEKKDLYKNLDRSENTIEVMVSYIFRLVENVRKYAKQPNEIPPFMQSYFSWYNTPKLSPVKSFERIYVFNNYFQYKHADTGKLKRVLSEIKQSAKKPDNKKSQKK